MSQTKSNIARWLVYLGAAITFGTLFFMLVFIFIKGVPYISTDLFAWEYTSENVSLIPALITTLYTIFGALIVAGPIGIFTAIYLVEYADRTKPIVKLISMATDTLAAVPSIVYGLFGFLFFVTFLEFSFSLIAGILTMTIMVLPLIIRSTEEALLAVGRPLREASYALGAGKLRTIFNVVLPVAMPGILSGVILAIGRIMGESAALIYTLGSSTNLPASIMASGRTLAVHMYVLSNEGFHVNEAYATAVILVFVVLILNGLSTLISQRVAKGGK